MTTAAGRPRAGRDVPADAAGCAEDRVEFLTQERAPTAPTRVRPAILASWQRSRERGLRADRVEVPFVRDPVLDTPLSRCAAPVLRRLADRLAGGPATDSVSIILTDPAGLVVSRRTPDAAFERQLDRVLLAPGFSYAERFAGTNGIGTALETGTSTRVFGHEHYAEDLERLACAAAPIHDPISGRIAGVLDLTCWRKDSDALLLTLAETTAEQIQHAMRENAGRAENAVLRAYRQACRRSGAIVLAVTADAVTLNDRARAELEPLDQAALIAQGAEVAGSLPAGARRSVDVLLAGGARARMACLRVEDGDGVVLTVRTTVEAPRPGRAHATAAGATPPALPGIVGDSLAWRQVCTRARTAGGWLAFTGETGVGKLTLARAVVGGQRGAPRVLDARDAAQDRRWSTLARAALAESDRVVVAHLDALSRGQLRRLADAISTAAAAPRREPLRLAVTLGRATRCAELDQLLETFGDVIEVPPLRLRPDDVPSLVAHFLAGQRVSCAADAQHLLTRAWWPGNVAQLRDVVRRVRPRQRDTITADDLPDEIHSLSRRVLTPIESLERDAIVASLVDAHGNRGSVTSAARALGISRATIYRRIRDYGISH